VEQAIAPFAGADGLILFKKVDSAGRGHIGAETMAALRASGSALALVAPGFPAAGRTVVHGVLHVRDSAEQNTSLPLLKLFNSVDEPHIELLPFGTESHLQQAILGALSRGARVLLCDAETQDDLVRLATAAHRLPERILWTGSAGLARAIASIMPRHDLLLQRDQTWHEGRILIFVGTDHPVTQRQIEHLHRKARITSAQIHSINWNKGSADGVRSEFAHGPVSALIVTGGDTAAFVLAQLNARAIRLIGELAPGVPWGFIEGGIADGCAVVTKSGGFGEQETLVEAFNFCSRRVCEPA
jgi:uncharacterized protein YgbK (DUF1537 family)